MTCDREFYDYSVASILCSIFYNANRGKNSEPATPLDFNPWADGVDKNRERMTPRSSDVSWEEMGRLINGEIISKKIEDKV